MITADILSDQGRASAAGDTQSGKLFKIALATRAREQIVSSEEEPSRSRPRRDNSAARRAAGAGRSRWHGRDASAAVSGRSGAARTAPPAGGGEPKSAHRLPSGRTARLNGVRFGALPTGRIAHLRAPPSGPRPLRSRRRPNAARRSALPRSAGNESAPAPPARTRTAMPQPTRSGSEPPAASSAGSLCNSPRKRPRRKPVPLSAVYKPNFPTSLAEKRPSSDVRIWARKVSSTAPWWDHLRPRKRRNSSVRPSKRRVAPAWFRVIDFPR